MVACEGNSVDVGNEFTRCGYALSACRDSTGGGPLSNVYRRQVSPSVGHWQLVDSTCFAPTAPTAAVPGRPGVTVEQVRAAFARTPFKRPVVGIQPPGGRTLINLPTYVEAVMPAAGYGPGQVHTVTLLGRAVRIRVLSAGYTFDFGDGTPVLRTQSAGGPYPDGDVRHTYTRDGVVWVKVSAAYRGEYSVDGSAWRPVGQTVTLNAAPVRLEVVTAPARLVAD